MLNMRSQVNTEIVAVKTNDLTASNTVRTFGGAIAGVENYSEKHCEEHESHIHFCSTAEVYFQDCFIPFPATDCRFPYHFGMSCVLLRTFCLKLCSKQRV